MKEILFRAFSYYVREISNYRSTRVPVIDFTFCIQSLGIRIVTHVFTSFFYRVLFAYPIICLWLQKQTRHKWQKDLVEALSPRLTYIVTRTIGIQDLFFLLHSGYNEIPRLTHQILIGDLESLYVKQGPIEATGERGYYISICTNRLCRIQKCPGVFVTIFVGLLLPQISIIRVFFLGDGGGRRS